ncbi:energy transducer TonB, partial [Haemophilus haemoglobinophilus]|nr:energy transducer TonB [Canicola haemoglobinophilus]
MKKHHSWFGFFFSLLFHCALIGGIFWLAKPDDSANGYRADLIGTNISMEMIMGMVMEEPKPEPIAEPEPVKEPEPVATEEVADPTIKPEPEKKLKEPEKPKEKPKKKPKERTTPKPAKDLPKGDRNIDSDAKVNSQAMGLGNVTSNNPNLIGTGNSADETSAYKSALRREIERHKRYPQRAKMMRKQGIVTVSFSIGADGSLSQISVAKSSGAEDLDKAALSAVQSARNIGPKPAGLPSSISVPISFK